MGTSWPPEGPTQMSEGEGHVAGERAQAAVVILRGGGGGRRGAWRERKQLQLQQPWLLCGGVWPSLPLCDCPFDQIKRGGNGWGPLKS